jgi:hypothetical protein
VEQRAGLLEPWVGKFVGVLPAGESEPWVALLEGCDERGVVLRYREEDIRADEASEESEERHWSPQKPCLLFFPWTQVSLVGITLEELDED